MGAVAQSAVTIEEVWTEGNTNGRKLRCVQAIVVTSSQGGLTNNIPATLFGFTKIYEVCSARDSNSVYVGAGPSYDGTLLVLYTLETNGSPADKSVTYRLIVKGTPE